MSYIVEIDKETIELDDEQQIDAVQINDSKFHVLENNQKYEVDVIEADFASKKILLAVNGNKYCVEIKDEYDLLVDKLGFAAANNQKLKNIKAPMPGLIIDVLVKPGQAIEKGDHLLILEAMKMENVLKSEGEGVVKEVLFAKGSSVDKGEVIIEME